MTLLEFMRKWSEYEIEVTIDSKSISATIHAILQAFNYPQMKAVIKIDIDTLIDFEIIYGQLDDMLDSMLVDATLDSVPAKITLRDSD